MVEPADTPDSNSGAARREGSSPSSRTCHCGMPYEDYMHDGWHRIHVWNRMVFDGANEKAEKEFDDLLAERDRTRRKNMPTMPKKDDTLWAD